jgi:hypothetical protein
LGSIEGRRSDVDFGTPDRETKALFPLGIPQFRSSIDIAAVKWPPETLLPECQQGESGAANFQ